MAGSSEVNVNRLLIVSSRTRNKLAIKGSILPNVIKVEYEYETSTVGDLVSTIFSASQTPRM